MYSLCNIYLNILPHSISYLICLLIASVTACFFLALTLSWFLSASPQKGYYERISLPVSSRHWIATVGFSRGGNVAIRGFRPPPPILHLFAIARSQHVGYVYRPLLLSIVPAPEPSLPRRPTQRDRFISRFALLCLALLTVAPVCWPSRRLFDHIYFIGLPDDSTEQ